jgi:hypothetical protein
MDGCDDPHEKPDSSAPLPRSACRYALESGCRFAGEPTLDNLCIGCPRAPDLRALAKRLAEALERANSALNDANVRSDWIAAPLADAKKAGL